MAFVYTQNNEYDAAFDPKRCKASVSGGRVTVRQCQRKPWRDGRCRQHHPDIEYERRKASQDRYDGEWKRREEARVGSAIELLREMGYTIIPPKQG